MNQNRLARIDSEIQTALSNAFTFDVDSKELKGTLVTIISCKITDDLKYCKVLVSIFPDKDKEKKLFAVKNCTPFLRKIIASKVNLRIVPELQFELDNSTEYGAKIDSIIAKIHKNDGENANE